MSRIYVDLPLKAPSRLTLTGEPHHYIAHVLRMRIGDPLFLFNGTSDEYEAKIIDIQKQKSSIEIIKSRRVDKESPLRITVAQAIPKGQKLDEMLPRITELGVSVVQPLITDRSDLKKVSDHKLKRWQKIVAHSAQQTGRTVVPTLSQPLLLSDFLSQYSSEKILFYELESSQPFRSILETTQASELCFIIGPEGGFSPEEIALAKKHRCHIVSLGKRILRTETVAPAVCAIAQYVKGDLNRCKASDMG